MNEQLVNELIAVIREQITAQREQTEAISRLAESNMALCDVIIQSLAGELDETAEQQTYLSGKPRGQHAGREIAPQDYSAGASKSAEPDNGSRN